MKSESAWHGRAAPCSALRQWSRSPGHKDSVRYGRFYPQPKSEAVCIIPTYSQFLYKSETCKGQEHDFQELQKHRTTKWEPQLQKLGEGRATTRLKKHSSVDPHTQQICLRPKLVQYTSDQISKLLTVSGKPTPSSTFAASAASRIWTSRSSLKRSAWIEKWGLVLHGVRPSISMFFNVFHSEGYFVFGVLQWDIVRLRSAISSGPYSNEQRNQAPPTCHSLGLVPATFLLQQRRRNCSLP